MQTPENRMAKTSNRMAARKKKPGAKPLVEREDGPETVRCGKHCGRYFEPRIVKTSGDFISVQCTSCGAWYTMARSALLGLRNRSTVR